MQTAVDYISPAVVPGKTTVRVTPAVCLKQVGNFQR